MSRILIYFIFLISLPGCWGGHWENWTEEALLSDGRVLKVERQVFFTFSLVCGDEGSGPMTFCSSPDTYRLSFEYPEAKKKIHWDGDRYFTPILIDFVNQKPFLVVMGSPNKSNIDKYGCPDTPYIFLQYRTEQDKWIPLEEAQIPSEKLNDANLAPDYNRAYQNKVRQINSVVYKLVQENNGGYFQIKVPRNFESWHYNQKRQYLEDRYSRPDDCLSIKKTTLSTAQDPRTSQLSRNTFQQTERPQQAHDHKVTAIRSFKDCSTCPEMVPIPGNNYAMGKYEITQAEWRSLMDYVVAEPKSPAYGDRKPVYRIPWDVVNKFISRLNEKTGQTYRLPTENEWEYACYGGATTQYCGGNDADLVAWHRDNHGSALPNVGEKEPNAFGLYDMSGNMWEMMDNCWNQNCGYRIVRGGSIATYPMPVTDAYIRGIAPENHLFNVGFRLIRIMPQASQSATNRAAKKQ